MFTKDSRTEHYLTHMGVEWKYTYDVAMSSLTAGWDARNLARPVPIRDDAVLEYAALMEQGSAAPAPILHKDGESYEILDGVQRVAAAREIRTSRFAAYVVTCDSQDTLDALRVLSNARLQGRAEPAEWTRKRAVQVLVLQRGLNPEEVARMGGWRATDIKSLAVAMEWGFEVRAIGGPENMPVSMLEVLAQHTTREELRKAPTPISQFLNVISDSKLSASDSTSYMEYFFAPIQKLKNKHDVYSARLQDVLDSPEIDARLNGRKYHEPRDLSLKRSLNMALSLAKQIEGPVVNSDEFFKLLKAIDVEIRRISGSRYIAPTQTRTPADKWSRDA